MMSDIPQEYQDDFFSWIPQPTSQSADEGDIVFDLDLEVLFAGKLREELSD